MNLITTALSPVALNLYYRYAIVEDSEKTKTLRAALSVDVPSKPSFEVNKFIRADPSFLVGKHQLFKVRNAVNAILQIITRSGHFIVNQAVRPKATLETQAFAPRETRQLLKGPYARYPYAENEVAITTNPVWLTSLNLVYIRRNTF